MDVAIAREELFGALDFGGGEEELTKPLVR